MDHMTYLEAQKLAIQAAKAAVALHYPAARQQLAQTGLFGKKLDNKARKLALKMGGFELQKDWTIAMVTPDNWADVVYRAPV